MDLRLEVQPLVQEYLTAREEDAAWMRGPWNSDRQAAYERLLSYVCRKFSEPMLRNGQWREWAENRPAVARTVRELVRLSGEQRKGDCDGERQTAEAGEVSSGDAER